MGNVRSLPNKMDELAALTRHQREYRESSLLLFTETWLTALTPDTAAQLEGFTLLRADRSRESGKRKGGGLAVFVNDRWCNSGHITIKEQHCCKDIELLAVSMRPHYLPREFTHALAVVVYIPPSANADAACDVLLSAVSRLHTQHPDALLLISGDFNHASPSSSLPKFTQSFSTRFPHSLFTDSFRFLKTLRNSKTDDRKLTIEFYNETLNRLENVEETTGMTKESGKSKKQNVSSEDDGARDGPEMKESTVEEEKEKGEEKNPEGRLTSDSAEVLLATESGDDRLPKAASEEAPDVSDMMVFSLDSPGGVCMTSLTLISLGMLNVHISIPKHIVVVDSNLVDNDTVKSMAALDDDEDDDDDENEEGERKQMVVKAHQASHTKYLMIRGYCNPGIVKRRDLHTVDSIVVESCIIRLQLRNTPAHHLLPREDALLDLNKCGPDMLPPSLTFTYPSPPSSALECESRLIQRGYTPQDVEACARLQRNLDAAGEAGLDLHDLCKTHALLEDPRSGRTRNLLQYMKDLREEGQVVQVGCLAMRWVLTQHADPWLLTLQTKWATALPTRDEPKTQSNVRKRSRRDALRETECPAKRSTVDAGEAEHATKPPGEAAEKRTHEEELGDEEGKDGGKLMNVEAGQQVQPEDIAGEKKMEAEEEQEKSEPAVGDEEEHLPTAASSDVDDEKIWSFVSRPWRMVDSNLNRPVCKGMLEGVLCHIMSRPGITHHMLVEHYKTVLQPMALLDLVEALIDMDCVVKKTLVKSAKPSLFSCPASSAEARPGMEELDAVYYEPTLTCSLRLAQVLPYERHWNYCLG